MQLLSDPMIEKVVLNISQLSFEKTAVEIAAAVGAKMNRGCIAIPPSCGAGRFSFIDFSEYASVIRGEFFTEQQFIFTTNSPRSNFYTLVLTEHTDKGLERVCDPVSVQLFHSAMSNSVACCYQTNMRLLMINFDQTVLREYLLPQVSESCLNGYFSRMRKDHLYTLMHHKFRDLLEDIFSIGSTDPFRDLKIFNRVMLLLEVMMLKVNEQPAKPRYPHKQLDIFQAIESSLVKDFSRPPPTIEQLSLQYDISATHLKKRFKEVYGLPIYEYYQKSRMCFAKRLIETRQLSMKEVGMQVGYVNLSHFAAAFKKEFGVLPSRFHHSDWSAEPRN